MTKLFKKNYLFRRRVEGRSEGGSRVWGPSIYECLNVIIETEAWFGKVGTGH